MTTTITEKLIESNICQLHVGTSGFSYTEWVEAGFYPSGTKSGNMLQQYARSFSTTELNYTWYQMPRAEAIERHLKHVQQEFLFSAKLTRTLTHEIDPQQWSDQAALYREGVAPLIQAGQLIAVLIQLRPRSIAQRQIGHIWRPCLTAFTACRWLLNFDTVPGPVIVYLPNWNVDG